MFDMVVQEIKRSGYDGLLPAGMVITGGGSALPGMRRVASRVLGVPARTSQPEKLLGMTDQLRTTNVQTYTTHVGFVTDVR